MDATNLSALMGEELSAESFADMWVAVPGPAAAPLLGEARRLADLLGCYVHAIVPEASLAQQAIALGADRVHAAPAEAWGDLLLSQRPEFAFFPLSHGPEAAQLAQRLRAGLITDARNLSIDDSSRALLGSHPVYGGDYFLDFAVTSFAKIATLDPLHLPEPSSDSARSGQAASPAPSAVRRPPPVTDLGAVDYTPQAWRPLTKARLIVCVGRGLKDEAAVSLARQLAEDIGAEFAGDQSARDAGWVDEAHQVGVTAQEVAPDLYLAFGVRGDTVHNAAMTRARRVIAVHSNPQAAIFPAADLAVVAEPRAFLTALLEQLR